MGAYQNNGNPDQIGEQQVDELHGYGHAQVNVEDASNDLHANKYAE